MPLQDLVPDLIEPDVLTADFWAEFEDRRFFFAPCLEALEGTAVAFQTNLNTIAKSPDTPGDLTPIPNGALVCASQGRPITLHAACCIKQVIDFVITDNAPLTQPVRDALNARDGFRRLGTPHSRLVSSIYYLPTATFRSLLTRSSKSRRSIVEAMWANQPKKPANCGRFTARMSGGVSEQDALDLQKPNAEGGEFRVTQHTAQRLFAVMKEEFAALENDPDIEWSDVFVRSRTAGPRGGFATYAMQYAKGNAFAPFLSDPLQAKEYDKI